MYTVDNEIQTWQLDVTTKYVHVLTASQDARICDRVWEKGTFRAKIEFLISGTRG